jgi:hypothetical protein
MPKDHRSDGVLVLNRHKHPTEGGSPFGVDILSDPKRQRLHGLIPGLWVHILQVRSRRHGWTDGVAGEVLFVPVRLAFAPVEADSAHDRSAGQAGGGQWLDPPYLTGLT